MLQVFQADDPRLRQQTVQLAPSVPNRPYYPHQKQLDYINTLRPQAKAPMRPMMTPGGLQPFAPRPVAPQLPPLPQRPVRNIDHPHYQHPSFIQHIPLVNNIYGVFRRLYN